MGKTGLMGFRVTQELNVGNWGCESCVKSSSEGGRRCGGFIVGIVKIVDCGSRSTATWRKNMEWVLCYDEP